MKVNSVIFSLCLLVGSMSGQVRTKKAAAPPAPKPTIAEQACWEDVQKATAVEFSKLSLVAINDAGTRMKQCQSVLESDPFKSQLAGKLFALSSSMIANLNQITESTQKIAEVQKQYDVLHDAAMQVLNYAQNLEAEYKKGVAQNAALTDQYNELLKRADAIVYEANQRLARQQRINNALAAFAAMPKYTPPAFTPIPAPVRTTINCTSNQYGSTTYTNCQ